MPKPIISVAHLCVRYDGHIALNDVNFNIDKGEIVAVIGPNGSGKTTLIRAILGLLPYEGHILINGQPAADGLEKIGYVPQSHVFDRTIPMTAVEFLSLAFPRLALRKIRHVLQEVDMAQHERAEIGTFSGGQFQRLLIARAILNDPSLLLLDEATSGVDVAGAKGFYDIVAHLNKVHHTTVLFVSHEINMVYRFANQIICLNRDLVCYGKPKDMVTQEVLEKLYGKDIRFQAHQH